MRLWYKILFYSGIPEFRIRSYFTVDLSIFFRYHDRTVHNRPMFLTVLQRFGRFLTFSAFMNILKRLIICSGILIKGKKRLETVKKDKKRRGTVINIGRLGTVRYGNGNGRQLKDQL